MGATQKQMKNGKLSASVLRNLLMDLVSRMSFFMALREHRRRVGTKRSYICLMEHPIQNEGQTLSSPNTH